MTNRSTEHWFTNRETRLLYWREWRKALKDLNSEQTIAEVAIWWKFVPMINHQIDVWNDSQWPTAWELVGTGEFCANAQGLGIFYTLVLLGIDCNLYLVQVKDQPIVKLMVVANGTKLLNYSTGEAVNFNAHEMEILKTWSPSDLTRQVKV